jgi:hypothetical protein
MQVHYNEYCVAIPIFIQRIYLHEMKKLCGTDFAFDTERFEFKRIRGFDVIRGYELGLVFFHKTQSEYHKDYVHKMMLKEDFVVEEG